MEKMYRNFLVKCFLLVLATTRIDAVQRFLEMPTYTEVNPGEDALLKCRISEKKGVCSWQKDNKPVGIYRGKYEWANENSPMGGDCSLWVRAATLALDDGQWQCQVTASNYDVQDALSSPPAALAVRVPPQSPRILFNGTHILPNQNITVPAGARATVVCEARYGNPPAYIEWYLDKERLTAWSQTNASEVETPRVWAARSVLELGATRASHGRQLACRAHHPSYPSPYYRDSYTMLDVTFVPVVSINGADPSTLANLEEGNSALTLECRADGNPSPYVWWTKNGQVIATNGAKLILAPVMRNHSGIYGCQARNSVGTSDSVKIEIDVKYPPRVTWVGPDTVVEANLFSQVTLECKAEGNPPPSYQWYHNPNSAHLNAMPEDGYPISSTPQLQLQNVSYSQHGRYICLAINQIGLEDRTHQSEAITLNVLGPPVGAETLTANAWSGSEAKVHATVCADPPPRRAAWLWGSLRLDVPTTIGRYRALEPTGAFGCYRYTLLISGTSTSDARVYVLHVENERGFSSHAVSLTVHETAHVAPLIAAALVIAALLVVVFCLVIRCRRRRESVEYKTDDLDSEKTVLPADAVYAGQQTATVAPRYSPGALQAALNSLEREAKENVYAVLDPHIQYEITINKHGEPPKHLSLSKPLTHQRAHAFDTQLNEINNNEFENRFTTFKSGPTKLRRSNRSDRQNNDRSYVCKTNNDIEYSKDPYFGVARDNQIRKSKTYSRMYERNNSGKKDNRKTQFAEDKDAKKLSNRDWIYEDNKHINKELEKERSFEELKEENDMRQDTEDYKPRPGKVREIASRFNRNSANVGQSVNSSKGRPKPLQSYGNQAYLDHVFPDAVEI
ncbi:kin of IRRE-like protein 2 isoform X2 [Cydia fagiglandana]|uniref:kin of IRRE-like protein 2 isoform X2 n=1 Tax=Cydia fagiglandana TaxID=1458189 RepID=UPI002FEDE9F4